MKSNPSLRQSKQSKKAEQTKNQNIARHISQFSWDIVVAKKKKKQQLGLSLLRPTSLDNNKYINFFCQKLNWLKTVQAIINLFNYILLDKSEWTNQFIQLYFT